MLESSHIVAFAATTDLDRARAFYERVLGLPVTEQNDFACVLDANGCAMTRWIRTTMVSGALLAATRWPGSPTPTAMSCRLPSFASC